MVISSVAFKHNGFLPVKYTCDGEGVSPPLTFDNIPEAAKSLVLIVEDPDAPMKNFTHWVLFDIPARMTVVTENSIPEGAKSGANQAGSVRYYPACPPSGTHRYVFSLYAVDIMTGLAEGTSKDEIRQKIEGHVIEKAELIGMYKRE